MGSAQNPQNHASPGPPSSALASSAGMAFKDSGGVRANWATRGATN